MLTVLALMLSACHTEPENGLYGAGEGEEVALTRDDGAPATGRLGARLTPTSVVIYATSNDNSRFRLDASVGSPLDPPKGYLHLDGRTWAAGAVGRNGEMGTLAFDLDAPVATLAGEAFGVSPQTRTPLDAGLVATCTLGEAHVGGPIPVSLRVSKVEGDPVDIVVGGHGAGGRDDRFSFEVARDGVALPIAPRPGYGGSFVVKRLVVGDSLVFDEDLTRWLPLDAPGTYTVRCRWHGELQAPGDAPIGQRLHARWDLDVDQTLTLSLQP